MIAAQLRTIKTQLIVTIFTPEFAVGGPVLKMTSYLEMGSNIIENNIRTINHNGFPLILYAMGASAPQLSSLYLEGEGSSIESSHSTFVHTWGSIESFQFDLKIQNRMGMDCFRKHKFFENFRKKISIQFS